MLGDKKPVLMESDKGVTVATLGDDGKLMESQRPDLNVKNITGLEDALNAKQDTLEWDDAPLPESDNPVKSKGIYKALQNVKIELDSEPMPDSEKAVQSGGVYTALQSKADLGEDGKLKPEQLPDNIDAATLGEHDADYFATDALTEAEIDEVWNEVFTEVAV